MWKLTRLCVLAPVLTWGYGTAAVPQPAPPAEAQAADPELERLQAEYDQALLVSRHATNRYRRALERYKMVVEILPTAELNGDQTNLDRLRKQSESAEKEMDAAEDESYKANERLTELAKQLGQKLGE